MKESSTGRGRPPLPSEEARSERVVTLVTQGELSRLQDLASVEKQSLSATVHRLIKAGLDQAETP